VTFAHVYNEIQKLG